MSFPLLFAEFIVHVKTINASIQSFWNSTALTYTVLQHYACSTSPAHKDKHDRIYRSRVPYRVIGLEELVYSVVWGILLTECVGEETYRLSKEEMDRKTPKTPPVKMDIFYYRHRAVGGEDRAWGVALVITNRIRGRPQTQFVFVFIGSHASTDRVVLD